jgi:hypothetical protein
MRPSDALTTRRAPTPRCSPRAPRAPHLVGRAVPEHIVLVAHARARPRSARCACTGGAASSTSAASGGARSTMAAAAASTAWSTRRAAPAGVPSGSAASARVLGEELARAEERVDRRAELVRHAAEEARARRRRALHLGRLVHVAHDQRAAVHERGVDVVKHVLARVALHDEVHVRVRAALDGDRAGRRGRGRKCAAQRSGERGGDAASGAVSVSMSMTSAGLTRI